MSLVINTNLGSLAAQRHLAAANLRSQTMERLSTGQRINSAGDDAAGLSISNELTSTIRGLNQAIRNANDGISLLQVAEGALGETTSILQRMRELSVQAASGTYTNSNRATLDAEYSQLKAEIDRIAQGTSFNGINLLNGSSANIAQQVGAEANQTIDFNLISTESSKLGFTTQSEGFVGDELLLVVSTGQFKTNISNSITVNGISLAGVEAGDTLEQFLGSVNAQFDSLTASAAIQARATLVGTGVLSVTGEPPLPGWFTEGVAELMHGADDNLVRYYQAGAIDTAGELSTLFDEATNPGSPSAFAYSAAYLAAKMLNDDLVASGSSLKELINILEVNSDLDAAIQTLFSANKTNFANLSTFESYFDANGFHYLTGNALSNVNGNTFVSNLNVNLAGTAADEAATDTGSIFGSDYGGAARTATGARSVLNNDNTGTINQLTTALTFIVPDEYSGDFYTTTARLVLESDRTLNISLTPSGTDSDLDKLGLYRVLDDSSVIGASLSEDAENKALAYGDLIINGVSIEAVAADNGIVSKLDAINEKTSETSVVASLSAYKSFSINDGVATELYSTSGIPVAADEVVSVNGIGIQLYEGDSAYAVASRINTLTSSHGVLAYSDNNGVLHLYSDSALNVSGTAYTNMALTQTASSVEGSIDLNGTNITLTDITDVQLLSTEINQYSATTGVRAFVTSQGHLQLEGGSAIKVRLSDTNGLKTLAALGVTVGLSGNEALSDTDNDLSFSDEVYLIEGRIRLSSNDGSRFTVSTTLNGQSSTGLSDMNAFDMSLLGKALSGNNIGTQQGAQKVIIVIDEALNQVSDTLSDIGAAINRLDHTINNLASVSENTNVSRSRIMDADYATESAELSKVQIIQRVGTAMLAQANAQPQQVVSLLR